MRRPLQAITLATTLLVGLPTIALAQERLCDTQFEDCRAPLLELIRNERVGIDVAFWFMEDARYVNELINRHRAGVPIRILMDQRANATKRLNETMLISLRDGGIPMREKFAGDVLHFKMMLFHGQNVVQFSKANYTSLAFVPIEPNVNYDDEAVFFTNDDNLTNSFRRRFDDRWVDTAEFRNYANITSPVVRRYAMFPIHSSLNFPPLEDFSARLISRLDGEPLGIDAIVFRVTDARITDAVLRATGRRIPVRIITEPSEYRNPKRLWMAKEVDRLWMGGAQIKVRRHEGLAHEASVVMHGLGEVVFGSSNWTPAVTSGPSDEHNYFYNPTLLKPSFFLWFADQFERKWNDAVNYSTFVPLPPDSPTYSSPASGAIGLSSTVQLNWDGGTWAHLYDIYLGTTPNPPLVARNVQVGSPVAGHIETYTFTNLLPGTTYYWRIVGKTWAQMTASGPTWTFTTAGTPPAGSSGGTVAYGGTPASVPGTFQAENFDDGGQGIAYYDLTTANSGGVYRSTEVDLQATADAGGGYNVGWTRAGEWLQYTINVASTGTYTLQTRVANVGSGARFHVEVDGVDRTGPIAVPDTGGWQVWQTVSTPGISLTAGQRVLRVVLDTTSSAGGVGNYNWFQLVATSTTTTTPPPPPTAPATTAYGGVPVALPGLLQAENFDNDGTAAGHYDATAGNKGGAYRSTNVDIAATTDVGGGYYVGWTRAGEWLKYTVTIGASGVYKLESRVANIGVGATFHVEVDGANVTGPITVPDTGGWETWQTITTPGLSLSAGTRTIRVVFDTVSSAGGLGNYNWFRITH